MSTGNATIETSRGPVEVKPAPGAEKAPVTPQAPVQEGRENTADIYARNPDGSLKLKKDGTPQLKKGRKALGDETTNSTAEPTSPETILAKTANHLYEVLKRNKQHFGLDDVIEKVEELKEKEGLKSTIATQNQTMQDLLRTLSPAEIKAFMSAQAELLAKVKADAKK